MTETPITPGRTDPTASMTDATAAGSPTPIVVENYDQAQLPPPGIAGRIVRVPGRAGSRPGRLWLDDGAHWSAVVDQAVDVRPHGAVGDADTNADRDDTTAIQNALDTGEDVYLPRGAYRIKNTPLRFYGAQTIYGDAEGPHGVGTELLVHGGITALRSVNAGAFTRDVLIRDLSIQNEDTSGPAGSVGIDFTGVGFSRIERVSIRYHEYGIIGRDSMALSTTVRADSSGTVLTIPGPYPLFAAVGAAIMVTDGTTDSIVRITAQAGSDDPDYPALLLDRALATIYHAGALVCPFPIGGYYNSVVDCELIGCRRRPR